MRKYWVCQSCKSGQVDDEKPTKCLNCGKVGGQWKSSQDIGSFKLYKCANCENTVEERQPPKYSCSHCGSKRWEIYKSL